MWLSEKVGCRAPQRRRPANYPTIAVHHLPPQPRKARQERNAAIEEKIRCALERGRAGTSLQDLVAKFRVPRSALKTGQAEGITAESTRSGAELIPSHWAQKMYGHGFPPRLDMAHEPAEQMQGSQTCKTWEDLAAKVS